MTTPEELKHYYSIYKISGEHLEPYRTLNFMNKFFTRLEASNYIVEHPEVFMNLTLTILEIFEQ